MKKIVTISLIIFGAIAMLVLGAHLGQRQSSNGSQTNNQALLANASTTITLAEISKHNSAQSCWMAISGKVYDLTSFANEHSGGAGAILQGCGTDATVGFETKDGRGSHRRGDINVLNPYFLGTLK